MFAVKVIQIISSENYVVVSNEHFSFKIKVSAMLHARSSISRAAKIFSVAEGQTRFTRGLLKKVKISEWSLPPKFALKLSLN